MTYASEVAAQTPIMWWRFEETSGTSAGDASGNGRVGVYSTGSFSSVVLAQPGVLLDEPSSTGALVPFTGKIWHDTQVSWSHPTITGQFTAKIWMKWNLSESRPGTNTKTMVMWANGNGVPSNAAWSVRVRQDGTAGFWTSYLDPEVVVDSVDLLDGAWHFLVWELDYPNNTRNAYVDGTLRAVSTVALVAPPASTRRPWVGDAGSATDALMATVDEYAYFDHLLGPDVVSSLWWAARQGNLPPVGGVDLGLTVGSVAAATGQHVPVSGVNLNLTAGRHALTEPLRPGHVPATFEAWGPLNPKTSGTIRPATVAAEFEAWGPIGTPIPALQRPIRPRAVPQRSYNPGPLLLPPQPTPGPNRPTRPIQVPPSPSFPDGIYLVASSIDVSATDEPTAVDCAPTMNGVGVGKYRYKGAKPAIGTKVSFSTWGSRMLTGYVDGSQDVQVAKGEEVEEQVSVHVEASLRELREIIVLPDFGSTHLWRLGPPSEDIRRFNWVQNGIGDWSGDPESFGDTPVVGPWQPNGVDWLLSLPSFAMDTHLADKIDHLPLPDVWPDNMSQWMASSPVGTGHKEGWSLFRVATPPPPAGSVQFWLCAYDYAELWVDGVNICTADTPGTAVHKQVDDMRGDYHLIAIRAYTRGGKAGVNFTMMPVKDDGLLGPPTMNSRPAWWSMQTADAFVYTPGAVMRRLLWEAKERGNDAAAKWAGKVTFTNELDSAGRPWPEGPTIEMDVGMNLLEVLDRLAEDRVDYTESAAGEVLNMWVKGEGTGRSVPIPWAHAVDLDSRELQTEKAKR